MRTFAASVTDMNPPRGGQPVQGLGLGLVGANDRPAHPGLVQERGLMALAHRTQDALLVLGQSPEVVLVGPVKGVRLKS